VSFGSRLARFAAVGALGLGAACGDGEPVQASAGPAAAEPGILLTRPGVKPRRPDSATARIEEALLRAPRTLATDDLDAIRARGFLRVLTVNNAVSYYLHRGERRGFDYELARAFADELGVVLEMVVPPRAADLIPWLTDGRGDVIAASFTVTPDRERLVAFSLPYLYVDEVVVGRSGEPQLASPSDLRGRELRVRSSSSYARTLAALAGEHGPFDVVHADESLQTEELIRLVAAGAIAATVADSHILAVESTYTPGVAGLLTLTAAEPGALDTIGKPRREGKAIAFAVRRENPALRAALDLYVQTVFRGTEYNLARRRYFETEKHVVRAVEAAADRGRLSPFDDLMRTQAETWGLDWRLLAALAFQESRFSPQAESWAGARGLFQLMPATARELGVTDLTDPDESCRAAAQYLTELAGRFDESIPLDERLRFALASYNAGRGHVLDAMQLAADRGLDPHVWYRNVAEAMLLLEDPDVAGTTRYGYCRGSETARYVRDIHVRYANYVQLFGE